MKNNKKIFLIMLGIIALLLFFATRQKKEFFVVSFNTNNTEIISSKTCEKYELIELPILEMEGYQFEGWANEYEEFVSNPYTVIGDVNLTAIWTELSADVIYHTVLFDTNGSIEKINSKKIENGKKVEEPIKPTREGHTFKGWYLDGKIYDFDNVITKDITLKAKWTKNPTYYTITFDTNGGSSVSSQEIEEGKIATKPNNPTKEGHTFKGWYLDKKLYDFDSKVTKDIKLEAEWTKNSTSVTYYTVTFDTNGGSSVSTQKIEKGKTATKPSNPTRSGYTFKGWYLDEKLYDFDSKVTKDIKLEAEWTKNSTSVTYYTVTFDTNGGSSVSTQKIEKGKTATKPSNPTRSGYTFLGWYTNNKTQYNFGDSVTSNIKLSALWAPKLNYSPNAAGKWIFVNNPENLSSDNYLADKNYGNHLLYKTTFSGTAELYYEHGLSSNYVNKFYYAIRIYNPNATSVTLKINKCGATMGWSASEIWQQYYYGTCSLAGNTYTIPAQSSAVIYHNGNSYLYGSNAEQSKVSKISSTAFEGVLNMTVSNEVHIANLVFKDILNTYEATYNGNYTENVANETTARVYSGEYSKLPILTNNMTYEIYDQTPSGVLPVSYVATDGGTYTTGNDYTWSTNLIGGRIDTSNGYTPVYNKSQYVGDVLKIKVPTASGSFIVGPYRQYSETRNAYHAISGTSMVGWPYNWGNWAVHYQENITINNNSSTSKTVTFRLKDLTNLQTVNVLYNGRLTGYQKNGNQDIWTVTIPANTSKVVSAEILLGGHSNGNVTRELALK